PPARPTTRQPAPPSLRSRRFSGAARFHAVGRGRGRAEPRPRRQKIPPDRRNNDRRRLRKGQPWPRSADTRETDPRAGPIGTIRKVAPHPLPRLVRRGNSSLERANESDRGRFLDPRRPNDPTARERPGIGAASRAAPEVSKGPARLAGPTLFYSVPGPLHAFFKRLCPIRD